MKSYNAVSNKDALSIENKDRYFNKHRLNKTSIQAYLSDEEIAIIDRAKAEKSFAFDKDFAATYGNVEVFYLSPKSKIAPCK